MAGHLIVIQTQMSCNNLSEDDKKNRAFEGCVRGSTEEQVRLQFFYVKAG